MTVPQHPTPQNIPLEVYKICPVKLTDFLSEVCNDKLQMGYEDRFYRVTDEDPRDNISVLFMPKAKILLDEILEVNKFKNISDGQLRNLCVAIDFYFAHKHGDDETYGFLYISTRLYAFYRRKLIAEFQLVPDKVGEELLSTFIEMEVLGL